MIPRIQQVGIRTGGRDATEYVDLEEGESLLVGRNPDWARISPDKIESAKSLLIASPCVSSNHVLLRRQGGRLEVRDLGSRNGTWLAVPSGAVATTELTVGPLVLRLAAPAIEETAEELPVAVSWNYPEDYPAAVERAVAAWLDFHGAQTRVRVGEREMSAANRTSRIPLASGQDLVIEPLTTVGPGWFELMARLERFVSQQNLLFDTEESMRTEGLVVASPAMRATVARVAAAGARGARALLLVGPSGSGKEGLARCFHRHTGRSGPFVPRNCGMFSRDLIRAELFGAERGSFTGCIQRIVGAAETANAGTLFLDEVGEIPRDVQPMLLRFLDHGEYERLGSYGRMRRSDARVVAATNRDLRSAALGDEFRMDLWFRLSVHVVDVPPLRERPEDLRAYLRAHRNPAGRTLLDRITPDALQLLERHDWHGNFRELANFAERVTSTTTQDAISAGIVQRSLQEGAIQHKEAGMPSNVPAVGPSRLLKIGRSQGIDVETAV